MGGKRNGHLYIIEGDLTPMVRSDMNKKRIWDFTTAFRVNNHLSLQKQHGEHDRLEGPLHVECTFYLPFQGSYYKTHQYHGKYHLTRPHLSGLLIFVETVGVDIIFNSSSHIASADAKKIYYSDRPRVEFKLWEVKQKPKESNDI